MKINFFFVLLIIILIPNIFISCLSIYILRHYNYKRITNLEEHIVQKNDNVLSAYAISDIGDWMDIELQILIIFQDGQWIVLANVTEEQDKITIYAVNGYRVFHYRREINTKDEVRYYKTRFEAPYIETILEIELDMRFENLNQIIQDFDKIAAYMDSVEDINSERLKNKSIEWFWSEEASFKRIRIRNLGDGAWAEGIVFKTTASKPQVALFGRKIESAENAKVTDTKFEEKRQKQ